MQPFSAIQCLKKCFEEGRQGMCSVAEYNKATATCQLSVDSHQDVIDVADEMTGVFT